MAADETMKETLGRRNQRIVDYKVKRPEEQSQDVRKIIKMIKMTFDKRPTWFQKSEGSRLGC